MNDGYDQCRLCRQRQKYNFFNRYGNAICFVCLSIDPDEVLFRDMTAKIVGMLYDVEDMPDHVKSKILGLVKRKTELIKLSVEIMVYEIHELYCYFLSWTDYETAFDFLVDNMTKKYPYFSTLMPFFKCKDIKSLARAVLLSVETQYHT